MASIPRRPVPARPSLNPARSGSDSQDLARSQDDDDPKGDTVIQELLLREISGKLGTIAETSVHELRLIHSISDRISLLEDSKVEFVWNAVLQTIGIIFVIIFGVFAVLAYNASQISNKQSFEANQLALLGFCNQLPESGGALCAAISQQAGAPLTSLATAVLGTAIQVPPTTSLTSFTPTTTPTPSSSSSQSSSAPGNPSTSSSNPVLVTSTLSAITSSTATVTSTSNPSSLPKSGSSPHSSDHLSAPAIVGIIVGVFSVLMSIGASWFTFRAKFMQRPNPAASYDYLPVGGRRDG